MPVNPYAVGAIVIAGLYLMSSGYYSPKSSSYLPESSNRFTSGKAEANEETMNGSQKDDHSGNRRSKLKKMADDTLSAIDAGYIIYRGGRYDLGAEIKLSKQNTRYYSPDSDVKKWAHSKPNVQETATHMAILNISTLDAARLLDNVYRNIGGRNPSRTGVLNFASATKPGGGFKNGAEAQEESIARVSTLYPTLMTKVAQQFYNLHAHEHGQHDAAYYSHSMIYSPDVIVFRSDEGGVVNPFKIDVLSCAAVNAGEIIHRNMSSVDSASIEIDIEKEMLERMGRILYLFEKSKVRNVVLGTFGTGVFRNRVSVVARNWAHLLLIPDARFKDSFDRVIFAITGDDTFGEFKNSFEAWGNPSQRGVGKGVARSAVGVGDRFAKIFQV